MQYVLRSALGWVSIYVNHISARVKLTWIRADCTVIPANAATAGPQDINSSMTSFGEH